MPRTPIPTSLNDQPAQPRIDPRTGAPLPGPAAGPAEERDGDQLARGSVNFRPPTGPAPTATGTGPALPRTTTPPPGAAAPVPSGARARTTPASVAMPRTTTPSSATQPPFAQPPKVRARGTPQTEQPGPNIEPLRVLVFAPEKTRAAWIESELSRLTVTIQAARRVRTAVAALIKDPPPRPQLLVVDFDAVSAAELLELHAIRDAGWMGQVIGLGSVPIELRASLGVEHVFGSLVRDSLLDCIAGTTHGAVTLAMPVILSDDDDD